MYEQWLIDYPLTCLPLSHVTAFVVSILPLKNMCRGLSRSLVYFHMSYDHMSTWAHENEHQFSYDDHRLKKWFQSYGPISICNGTFLKFQVLFLYVIFFLKKYTLYLATITDLNPTDLNPTLVLVNIYIYIYMYIYIFDKHSTLSTYLKFHLTG